MAEKEKQFKHYPVDVKVRNFCGKSKLFFYKNYLIRTDNPMLCIQFYKSTGF